MSTSRRMKMTCVEYDEFIQQLVRERRMPAEAEKNLLSGHRRVCEKHRRDPALDELAVMYDEIVRKPEPFRLKQCCYCNKVCLHDENKWYTERAMEHRFRDDERFVTSNIEINNAKEYCDVCADLFKSDTTFESPGTTYKDEPPT